MKTNEFIPIAKKLTESNIYYNLKPGEHGKYFLGNTFFGSTENHYKIIWRKYGTLYNIVVFKTAEETTEILRRFNITEFIAKPTKSKRFCRLWINE